MARPHPRPRAAYTAAVRYALTALLSYVETYGDHQPQPVIADQEGSHDVPITVVARDPALPRHIDHWGWRPGLNPDPAAPSGPCTPSATGSSPRTGRSPHPADAAGGPPTGNSTVNRRPAFG